MKIGIISNLYPPFVRGGAEIVASLQAQGLKKAWQHVFVISTKPRLRIPSLGYFSAWQTTQDIVEDISISRFWPVNFYYYLDDWRQPAPIRLLWHLMDSLNIFSYFTVKKILEKEKPEVVITHNLMGLGFLIPQLLKKLNIRHVHVLHDVQGVTPSGLIILGQEKSLQHKFFRMIGYVKLMRHLFGSPEIVISPSRFLFNFYSDSGFFKNSKKYVLPNPVKALLDLPKRPSPNLHLLYVGQITKAKGILDFIASFRKLKLTHTRLHIVGTGPDLYQAKKLAGSDKRIIFYGWLKSGQAGILYTKVDILVVPSLCYENSPTVIYEALSFGIPVLAADIGGTGELIEEGKNGWIFAAGDFSALNQKILSLYKQREKINSLSDRCRQSVAPYVLENYIARLLDIINNEQSEKI